MTLGKSTTTKEEGKFGRAKEKAIKAKNKIKRSVRSVFSYFGVKKAEIKPVIPWSVAIFLISYVACCVLSDDQCWFVGWVIFGIRNFLCAFLLGAIAKVEGAIAAIEGEGAAINARAGGLGGAAWNAGAGVGVRVRAGAYGAGGALRTGVRGTTAAIRSGGARVGGAIRAAAGGTGGAIGGIFAPGAVIGGIIGGVVGGML